MKALKSNRAPFVTRRFILSDPAILARAIAAAQHAPVDPLRPLEMVIQERKVQRNNAQNDYYWRRVTEIAEQAWIEGRQYRPEILHEYFKRELLPEDDPAPESDYVRDNYRKWEHDPTGERILVGSTTMLTVRGFSDFTTRVEAFGAQLGVEFSANPMEGR
jgi:hypothetical protein